MTDATTMNFMPHRSSRGLPRNAHGGAPLATCDKWNTAGNLKTKQPPLQLRKPLSAGTWNQLRTRPGKYQFSSPITLWRTGASRLLVEQLSKARVNIMGLQEVRWYDSGQLDIDNYTLLWLARQPGHQDTRVMPSCPCNRLHSN